MGDRRAPKPPGLVGHTHEPALFWNDGHTTRVACPEPERPYALSDDQATIANPGAVCGNPAITPAGGYKSTRTPTS
ncbi:MAG: hypothetical protein ACR2QA_18655 [Solirubrobacteraceae bacterium]